MKSMMSRRAFTRTALAGLAAAPYGGLIRPARAADLTEVSFQSIWINDPEFSGYYIAMQEGYYAEEGLEINYLPGGPDVIPQASLLTGKADIALTSTIECAEAIVNKGARFKVVGAQFQKSPDSIISLEETGIKTVQDLVGKTVACPPLNAGPFEVLLELNGVAKSDVTIVPYTFDPTPLATGQVDAVIDFMTSLPFIVEQTSGKKTTFILFSDAGMAFGQDLVTVNEEYLAENREKVVGFLRASRKGWEDEFADPEKYGKMFEETWYKGNGYTPEATKFHANIQIPLMDHPGGVFSMDDAWIDASIASLAKIGIEAPRDMFDPSLLDEI
ncbi:ABC transporter substrate-binding protein [Maritimibacter alkaliphilus]|uniref:ABC transporter substrate-binding protein n=1 Tax=Maritimibacter alkaliphilus TaxID=404236 RepID=UPI001C940BD3|nr:ABC transporter substrate-binding protein [Maritimibacter alkaliphilus]MBY6092110.1 ABC transporter substrate-binding protein [Maritimibacter alkaliphilus]